MASPKRSCAAKHRSRCTPSIFVTSVAVWGCRCRVACSRARSLCSIRARQVSETCHPGAPDLASNCEGWGALRSVAAALPELSCSTASPRRACHRKAAGAFAPGRAQRGRRGARRRECGGLNTGAVVPRLDAAGSARLRRAPGGRDVSRVAVALLCLGPATCAAPRGDTRRVPGRLNLPALELRASVCGRLAVCAAVRRAGPDVDQAPHSSRPFPRRLHDGALRVFLAAQARRSDRLPACRPRRRNSKRACISRCKHEIWW